MATIHTFPDKPAETWRDLTDQLTAEQIAELEYCEREQLPPGIAGPQGQLNCARAMAQRNLVQAMCAGIATPTDAVDQPGDWEKWGDGYGRMYSAAATRASEARSMRGERLWLVDIFGVQFEDGRIERNITAQVDDEPMTAADARRLAAALIEAADELDALQ
jgi:hypothetical protein